MKENQVVTYIEMQLQQIWEDSQFVEQDSESGRGIYLIPTESGPRRVKADLKPVSGKYTMAFEEESLWSVEGVGSSPQEMVTNFLLGYETWMRGQAAQISTSFSAIDRLSEVHDKV